MSRISFCLEASFSLSFQGFKDPELLLLEALGCVVLGFTGLSSGLCLTFCLSPLFGIEFMLGPLAGAVLLSNLGVGLSSLAFERTAFGNAGGLFGGLEAPELKKDLLFAIVATSGSEAG